MTLHEYMLPETVAEAPEIEFVSHHQPPSPLFVGIDPEMGYATHDSKLYRLDAAGTPAEYVEQSYKTARREAVTRKPFSEFNSRFYIDLEDARAIPRRFSFDRDFNVFQYNRRIGDRTSILWRLENYFVPSPSLGHAGRVDRSDEPEFIDKHPIAIWRGSLAGSRWSNPFKRVRTGSARSGDKTVPDAIAVNSRARLVLQHSDGKVIDAAFTRNPGSSAESPIPESAYGEQLTTREMLKYRYLVCPAGNDVSSAFYWILQSKSIAFREWTPYETLPDYFVEPWVHYIPLMPGMSDIKEKIEFCEQNPQICLQIIERANEAYQAMTNAHTWEQAENEVLERLKLS